MELNESARPYCEALKEEGLLCKETHDTVIRFAPPLIITKEELDLALEKIRHVPSIMSKSCNNQFVRALKRNTLCYNMFESEIIR
ncbi:aminotransferase class III-fold pyridoxal phosphate-dependent enzyme [Staphylococcus aureus]